MYKYFNWITLKIDKDMIKHELEEIKCRHCHMYIDYGFKKAQLHELLNASTKYEVMDKVREIQKQAQLEIFGKLLNENLRIVNLIPFKISLKNYIIDKYQFDLDHSKRC
jgi:hypothetical protein